MENENMEPSRSGLNISSVESRSSLATNRQPDAAIATNNQRQGSPPAVFISQKLDVQHPNILISFSLRHPGRLGRYPELACSELVEFAEGSSCPALLLIVVIIV
jgi:hypothetical protein